MNLVLLFGWIPAVFIVFWLYTSLAAYSFPRLSNRRILLLIAHPDDEAMFFSSTLLSITNPAYNNQVKLLCLSTGNAEGLGETRRRELVKSALVLGVKHEDDVVVLDDAELQDSMTAVWSPTYIAKLLMNAYTPDLAKTPKDKPAVALLDTIITFDEGGVSGHANHKACYLGAMEVLKTLMKGREGWQCPITLYTLTSVNIARKYSHVLDSAVTMAISTWKIAFAARSKAARKIATRDTTHSVMLFVNGFRDYAKAQRAMTSAHKSQMRWFRWFWIVIGRYMVINDIRKVTNFG